MKKTFADSVFSRGRRYGRRFVSSWGGRRRKGYRSRRSYSPSRSSSYTPSTSISHTQTTLNSTETLARPSGPEKNYGFSARRGAPDLSGCGTFLLFMLMIIGVPLLVLTPLAVIAFPIFLIICMIVILVGCIKGL
jgi:hypothetical protein